MAVLLQTPAVNLRRFDHPPGVEHRDPEHEVTGRTGISFVEDGSFVVKVDGERRRFLPGSLFVMTAGMSFSCSHDHALPTDRCLSLTFDDQAVEDLLSADVPPLRPPWAEMSARQGYLRHRLDDCVPGDEVRLELLAGALFESLAEHQLTARRSLRAESQFAHDARRLDRAVELIESAFDRPLTLRELAAASHLSPFHFARVFRAMVGVPPHRYLTAVRLRQAAHRLDQGASVTDTCFDVGFGSLSHFVTAFRQRFGVLPSEIQRGKRFPAVLSALQGGKRARNRKPDARRLA